MEHTESGAASAPAGESAPRSDGPPSWLRNAAVWVGSGLAVAALVVLGVALLPGWWASLIGGWVLGVSDRGVVLGLVIGAVFTLLPLAVGLVAFRSGLGSRTRIALVVVALLLLLPNVLTVSVALARSDATSVLAIEAPGFRGATAVGIGATVLVIVVLLVVRWWSRRTQRSIDDARERAVEVGRARAAERDPGPAAPAAGSPAPAPDETVVDPGLDLADPDRPRPDPAAPEER